MIGQSQVMKVLRSNLGKVTRSNGRVMLTGPSGSGKEVAARFIHAQSNRASAAFVTVSCAAIEPEKMELVLFGQEGGTRGVIPGLLEQAHGGILYLDEVADMPLGTQSKILRVLVDQTFMRVDGSEKVKVDLRVISSTTRDLRAEISPGISAKSFTTGSMWCQSRCHPWPNAVMIFHFWPVISSSFCTRLRAWQNARSPRKPRRNCNR